MGMLGKLRTRCVVNICISIWLSYLLCVTILILVSVLLLYGLAVSRNKLRKLYISGCFCTALGSVTIASSLVSAVRFGAMCSVEIAWLLRKVVVCLLVVLEGGALLCHWFECRRVLVTR